MTTIDYSYNYLEKIENLPESLQEFNCGDNEIFKIENLPGNLQEFHCDFNRITKIENLPESSLKFFFCPSNRITKIENLPESVQVFWFGGNPIEFVDNVSLERYEKFFGEFHVKTYTKIKKIQRIIRKWYWRRKRKAIIISRATYNWVWKPMCADGTIGIRPRLDMGFLGIV